jgi:hypothetical protein
VTVAAAYGQVCEPEPVAFVVSTEARWAAIHSTDDDHADGGRVAPDDVACVHWQYLAQGSAKSACRYLRS